MTHLQLSNISKQFAETTVVKDFNLDVKSGEFVSFLGPSGCGKTTTLRMIAGFEVPTTGTVTLGELDITDKAPNQRNVGMVFQSYALFSQYDCSTKYWFWIANPQGERSFDQSAGIRNAYADSS